MKRKTYSYLLIATLALCTIIIFTNGLYPKAINLSPTPTIFDRPGDCTSDISISVTALSPNGKYVLARWGNGELARLWDVQTGNVLHTFVETPIIRAAFSPSSQHVLIGSYDGTAKLWDISGGTIVHKLIGNADASKGSLAWVDNVSFSPDGTYILTGDATGGYLWDTKTGTKLRSFPGHMESSDVIQFSPDGKHVLMDSTLGTVTLWDVQTGGKLHSFDNWRGVFSPDNQ
jgi:WD40 repeat protein